MTMKVTITKANNDPYQARVRAVDKVGDASKVSELGILRKEGDGIDVCCTSTRSIKVTEEPLEQVPAEAPAAEAQPQAQQQQA